MANTQKDLQTVVDEEFRRLLDLEVHVYYTYNSRYLVTVRLPNIQLLRQPSFDIGVCVFTFLIEETAQQVVYDAYHSAQYFYKDSAGEIMRLTAAQGRRLNHLVKEAVKEDTKRRAKLLADALELKEYLETQHLTGISITRKPVGSEWVLPSADDVWVLRFTLNGHDMAYGFPTTDGKDVDYVSSIESFVGKPLAARNKQLLRDVWHFHFGIPSNYVMAHEMPF